MSQFLPSNAANGLTTPSRRSTPIRKGAVSSLDAGGCCAAGACMVTVRSRKTSVAIIVGLPAIQHLTDLREKVVAREGLREIIRRQVRLGSGGIAGNTDKFERAPARAELLGELDAAHVRHPQVGQQQVDGVAVLIE